MRYVRTFTNKTNSEAFSPQANYTDGPTAPGRRILVTTFVDKRVSLGQRGKSAKTVNISFLGRSRYFFLQAAPQLSSRGWVDSVPDPIVFRKSCSGGNRNRDLRVYSQELWSLDHRGGPVRAHTFWDITSCSSLRANLCFGGSYRLYLQGRRVIRRRYQYEVSSKHSLVLASRWFLAWSVTCSSGTPVESRWSIRLSHQEDLYVTTAVGTSDPTQ
jgi:hypothetical protein